MSVAFVGNLGLILLILLLIVIVLAIVKFIVLAKPKQ
jgi:hypothetical protein